MDIGKIVELEEAKLRKKEIQKSGKIKEDIINNLPNLIKAGIERGIDFFKLSESVGFETISELERLGLYAVYKTIDYGDYGSETYCYYEIYFRNIEQNKIDIRNRNRLNYITLFMISVGIISWITCSI